MNYKISICRKKNNNHQYNTCRIMHIKKATIPGCTSRELMTLWFIAYAFGQTTPFFLHVLNCTKEDTEQRQRNNLN